MHSLHKAAVLTVVFAAGLPAAQAQTAGSYTGTTKDGNTITLTVGTDSNNATAVTAVSVGITAVCPGSSSFGTGAGYGQDAVISNDAFSFVESYVYLYQTVAAKFVGNTITGTISSESPSLVSAASGAPKKTVLCKSVRQTFSARLAQAPALASGPDMRPYSYHP